MKKFILLATVATLIFIGLTSCSNDQPTTPVTAQGLSTQYDAVENFTLPSYSNAASVLIDGSMSQEMALCPPPPPPPDSGRGKLPPPPPDSSRDKRPPGGGTGNVNPFGRFDPLGRVLNSLKLTTVEITNIRGYLKEHMDCVNAAMLALRESEKPIIENARTQQKAIFDQVKAGTMTRADAKVALKALNEATRTALEANPGRIIACLAMEACKKELYAKILAGLDDAQKALFQAWLDKQPVVDCNQTERPPK
jgi:hypothetical protein